MNPEIPAGTSIDAFLGGSVAAVQPVRGHHRSGLEAVLLAASAEAGSDETFIDLGAGAGVSGFCAAQRCPAARVVLIEREPDLVAAARLALALPQNAGIAPRVRVLAADVADAKALRSEEGRAGLVLVNPPFNPLRSMAPSPNAARADAHVLEPGGLSDWVKAAAHLLRNGGRVTLILRPDSLPELLALFGATFGTIDLLPVHPRRAAPAHRALVTALKGGRAPLRLLAPLILHADTGNAFRPEIDAILREGAALTTAVPTWQERR